MTDAIDRAAKLEQRQRDAAIAKARSRTEQQEPQMFDGDRIVCACCGEPIPIARLALEPHATLCVQCKTALENKGNR